MPFKNCAQVRALFAKNPKLAHEWVKKYGLPDGCKGMEHEDGDEKEHKAADRPSRGRRRG